MAALAAGGIEVELGTSALGQLAELAQELIARHQTWIAADAIGVKAEPRHSAEHVG